MGEPTDRDATSDEEAHERPDATRRLDPAQEPTALMGPDHEVARAGRSESTQRVEPTPPARPGDPEPPASGGTDGEPVAAARPERPSDPEPDGRPHEPPGSPDGDAPAEAPEAAAARSGSSHWFGDRDLPVAIASGLLLVGLLLGTLLTHPIAFTILIAALVLVGLIETGRVVRQHGIDVSVPVLLLASVLILVGAYRVGHAGQAIGLVALFVGAVVWELAEPDRRDVFRRIAATCLFGLWVPLLASYGVLLAVRPVEGWVAVIGTVGVAVVGDIGAYAVGTRFGRHKLAPSISPGKSWEGVVGGIGIATLVAVVVLPVLGTEPIFTPLNVLVFAPIVGLAGVLGDLTESMLKRDLGVKDFGGIIPGHGGILDRVDALLFALPTGYYVLALLGR